MSYPDYDEMDDDLDFEDLGPTSCTHCTGLIHGIDDLWTDSNGDPYHYDCAVEVGKV